MIVLLSGVIAILIPLFLLYQIGRDIYLGERSFFRFFERLSLAERSIYTTSAFALVLSLWFLLSFSGFVEPRYLPKPTDTVAALWDSILSGELAANTLVSIRRIVIAFGLTSLLGVMAGSLAGTFARLESLIIPLNSAIRYIPPTAFIGLTIIWFGIEEASKIALISLGVIFYITQMTSDIIRLVPKVYIQAAQTLGANRWEIFTKVVLMMSVPEILAVLRINLGASWTFLIVAEIVAAQQGLGYLMAISQRFLQTPKLFALLVVVGILGFISDALIALAIRRVGRWK